jgi:hypothetical protein
MKQQDFDELMKNRLETCAKTLQTKAEEYATFDRLHNFKRAALMQGCTPARALVGMWAKHLVSVLDIVDEIEGAGQSPDPEKINEKFTDCINYLLLLEALLVEWREPEDGE